MKASKISIRYTLKCTLIDRDLRFKDLLVYVSYTSMRSVDYVNFEM